MTGCFASSAARNGFAPPPPSNHAFWPAFIFRIFFVLFSIFQLKFVHLKKKAFTFYFCIYMWMFCIILSYFFSDAGQKKNKRTNKLTSPCWFHFPHPAVGDTMLPSILVPSKSFFSGPETMVLEHKSQKIQSAEFYLPCAYLCEHVSDGDRTITGVVQCLLEIVSCHDCTGPILNSTSPRSPDLQREQWE